MTSIATKSGKLVVVDGKLAEKCECCESCSSIGDYAVFRWLGTPPPSQAIATAISSASGSAIPNDAGFCACYWSDIPMTFSPSASTACYWTGGVPLAGLRHSRRHVVNESSQGPAIAKFVDAGGRMYFDIAGGGRHSLEASATELRVTKFNIPNSSVLIGIHSANAPDGPTVLSGTTVSNPITGSGAYSYEIRTSTAQECESLWTQQVGRSLQDCEGNRFFDQGVPWQFDFSTEYQGVAPYDNLRAVFFNAISQGFSFSEPKSPSGLSFSITNAPVSAGFSVATATNEALPAAAFNEARSACGDGCKYRYKLNGLVQKFYDLGAPEPYMWDQFYFDDVYSPCLSTIGGQSWTHKASRHNLLFQSRNQDPFFNPYFNLPLSDSVGVLTVKDSE